MAKKLFIGAVKKDDKSADTPSQKRKKELESKELGTVGAVNRWLASHSSLKMKDKVVFFRLFATMIHAGVSIIKSLEILIQQVESPKLKIILEDVEKFIKKGKNLSSALEELYPDDFTQAEVGMIRSGEASGKLNISLLNLAEQSEKSSSLTKKLKGAMMYPAVIFIILIAALFAVMTFVIPQIKEMFESFGADLPLPTQMLISFSDFMVARGGPFDLINALNIIFSIIGVVLIIMVLKKTPKGRYVWDALMLKLPVFGTLNQKVAISKMCRGLATLLSSGISVIKALDICADMIGNETYKFRILKISEDVKIGITISDNLRGDYKFFPPLVISMIGVGEQTAQLDKICMRIAEFYEDDVEDMVKNLSSLLEPLIIVVVGLSVGGLVISIMLPILQMSDLAGA